KGPSVTVRFPPPWNVMRAPLELGWSPSPASITPAFTISWLNSSMAATSSLLGRTPASVFLSALIIIINRIVMPPSGLPVSTGCEPWLYSRDERGAARSTRSRGTFPDAAKCSKCQALAPDPPGHGPPTRNPTAGLTVSAEPRSDRDTPRVGRARGGRRRWQPGDRSDQDRCDTA